MSSTKKMKAKHTFVPLLKKEISLVEGEVIQVVAEHEDGWWEGKRSNGQVGGGGGGGGGSGGGSGCCF